MYVCMCMCVEWGKREAGIPDILCHGDSASHAAAPWISWGNNDSSCQ